MPQAHHHNARLNDLLVCVYRSLLQYAGDCWPWAENDAAAEERAVAEMAREQKSSVEQIVELLAARGWVADFGSFPDNSELHYVSLDYLLGKLIEDEERITGEIEQLAESMRDDREAAEIAWDLLIAEQRHLAKLRELQASRAKLAHA